MVIHEEVQQAADGQHGAGHLCLVCVPGLLESGPGRSWSLCPGSGGHTGTVCPLHCRTDCHPLHPELCIFRQSVITHLPASIGADPSETRYRRWLQKYCSKWSNVKLCKSGWVMARHNLVLKDWKNILILRNYFSLKLESYSQLPQLAPDISSTVKLWTSSSQGRLGIIFRNLDYCSGTGRNSF